MIWLGIYILGYILVWNLVFGWMFANEKARYEKWETWDYRDSAGAAFIFAFILAAIWPVGWLLMFCVTGFAEYGWEKPWKVLLGLPKSHRTRTRQTVEKVNK